MIELTDGRYLVAAAAAAAAVQEQCSEIESNDVCSVCSGRGDSRVSVCLLLSLC